MSTKFYVVEAGKCPECHGEQFTGTRLYCEVCDSTLTSDDIKPGLHIMSCGHDSSSLREEDTICSTCEGEGTIRREIPLEEALNTLRKQSTMNQDIDTIIKQNERLKGLISDVADRSYICPWCGHARGEHTKDCEALEVLR